MPLNTLVVLEKFTVKRRIAKRFEKIWD